jgi:hypothetical protein
LSNADYCTRLFDNLNMVRWSAESSKILTD